MADRSSREIERELEHQRAELRSTIEEALDRMTLEGAWNYAGKYLRDDRGAYGQSLGSVIKEKPLAVGLVAIGMAWIMCGSSTPDRRSSREEEFRRADRQDDAETRARLEAGDFDDTGAQGPTGPDARPDPWAAPTRTPSSATPAPRETRTGSSEGTPSPTKSTSTAPGGTPSRSTGSLSGSSDTRGGAGEQLLAAPTVIPASKSSKA